MKSFIILAISFILMSSDVLADQRFESWQGLCHFAYDTNDDDNEVYFANCINSIDTFDAGDGQGRLAYGSSTVSMNFNILKGEFPRGIGGANKFIKGSDANPIIYGDNYTVAVNTPCVMVTSNYDANADDNNETVYVTNDYNLEIVWKNTDTETMTSDLTYNLACRGGVPQ